MPTHFRAQIAWQVDSMLARDAVTINPCFRHQNVLPFDDVGWQTLADDLAAAINGHGASGNARQLTVKLYEIKAPVAGVPNRPTATKVLNAGLSSPTNYPGEIALCLSFYGGQNAPYQRGRLYVTYFVISTSLGASPRPSGAHITVVTGLVAKFAALGGVNVDWGVWSPTRSQFTKATNYFVDDEYDTQRRRGLKPLSRTAGTTSG